MVANLGVACTKEIIDGAKEYNPEVIIISSLNGEAEKWSSEFISKLKKGKRHPKDNHRWHHPRANKLSSKEVEMKFINAGFDYALDRRRSI